MHTAITRLVIPRPSHRRRSPLVRTAGTIVAAAAFLAGTLSAQAPNVAEPKFDVASVRENISGDGPILFRTPPGGFAITNAPLREIIRLAYRLEDYEIVGAPVWVSDRRYDINARAESAVPQDQLWLMMRALLAERFQLVIHTENREVPVYRLTQTSREQALGPALRRSMADCAGTAAAARGASGPARGGQPPPPGAAEGCGFRFAPTRLQATGVTMAQLAQALAGNPLVRAATRDHTSLEGLYDFELQWTVPEVTQGADAATAPSLFFALQEQLGLKLEPQRGLVDVLVVDRVERPQPN